jgi:hypothetical protein
MSYNTLQNARHFVVNPVGYKERSISGMLSLPTRLINVSLVVLCHFDLVFKRIGQVQSKAVEPSDLRLRLRQSKPHSRHSTVH